MSASVPIFEAEDQVPQLAPTKPRRGVTVLTQYGRAVTFGVPRERVERIFQKMAQQKNTELMAAMQERKDTRLKAKLAPPTE